jgi:hypothetical protein
MSDQKPVDGAALLAGLGETFELREESVQIVLAPRLLDEWEAKQQALQEQLAKDASSPRLANGKQTTTAKKLAKELEDFEAGPISAAAVWFRFRAMSKDDYRALTAAHPPRKGDQLDTYMGFNREAVDDAMIRACLYDPVFADCTRKGCVHDDCGSWQQFVKKVNPSEWAELEKTVQEANRAVTQVPKSLLPSVSRRLSGSASESQNDSE